MKPFHLSLIVAFFTFGCNSQPAAESPVEPAEGYLTMDGAWCWFSDPRAVYMDNPSERVITGWVKKDGSVEAAAFFPETEKVETNILFPAMQVDDHNNPAFAILPDQTLFTAYTWHSTDKGMVIHRSTEPGDIHSLSAKEVVKPVSEALLEEFPRETYTYANPYVLRGENNRLYCFGRWTGFKPNMVWSDDDGESWSEPKVVISEEPFDRNNRPYVKYFSNGDKRIHLIFTDGHPRVEPVNSVYYCYYENGAFWRVDGSLIRKVEDLPFDATEATVVYQATEETGRAWIYDVVADEEEYPVIAYTRCPEETDHRYHYARFDGTSWLDTELCKGGKWFPQTQPGTEEREVHYSGGLTIHPAKPGVVYLSRQINDRFEIEKWTTADGGKTWGKTPVTSNSEFDQIRPYVPRELPADATDMVFWMENQKYIHYTDFDTRIRYRVEK